MVCFCGVGVLGKYLMVDVGIHPAEWVLARHIVVASLALVVVRMQGLNIGKEVAEVRKLPLVVILIDVILSNVTYNIGI